MNPGLVCVPCAFCFFRVVRVFVGIQKEKDLIITSERRDIFFRDRDKDVSFFQLSWKRKFPLNQF